MGWATWREGNGPCGASEREGMGWLWLRVLGWAEEGKKERARREGGVGLGQAVSWVGLGFGVFFFSFPFLILIQTKLNLFEFKFEFEFKPHSIK